MGCFPARTTLETLTLDVVRQPAVTGFCAAVCVPSVAHTRTMHSRRSLT